MSAAAAVGVRGVRAESPVFPLAVIAEELEWIASLTIDGTPFCND